MPAAAPSDLARAVHDAANALTVARGRTQLLQRRLDAVAGDRVALAATLTSIRAALDRVCADLRVIAEGCTQPAGSRGRDAASG